MQSFLKDTNGQVSIIADLERLAKLADTFVEQRPKSAKGIQHMFDSLDQEGVNLWNLSGVVTGCAESSSRNGLLRLAAFRLVQAGLEAKPGIETLLNLLRMASKTGLALSEAGNNAAAGTVLTSAAKYEELLRNEEDPEGVCKEDIASSTIVYLSSRMEAAWNEGNVTVAEFMSKKIAEDEQRLALLAPQVREYLAVKFHNIGRSMVKDSKSPASDAVVWLQRALTLVDMTDSESNYSLPNTRVSILRTLALAYFTAESYDSAEAVLDELIPKVDGRPAKESQEFQELRWLRLAIYKRRKAQDLVLIEALRSIVDHMPWSESSITEVLQELSTLSHQNAVIMTIHQHGLHRAVKCRAGDADYIDRFLISMIFHCSKDDDHARAMKTLEDVFAMLLESEVNLGNVSVLACLTLLWRCGGKLYSTKKWASAADWYLLGSHKLFRRSSRETSNKCCRKAALCYIEQKEYAKASTVIRHCSDNEASTYYVEFLTAVYQGLEDEGAPCRLSRFAPRSPLTVHRTQLLLSAL